MRDVRQMETSIFFPKWRLLIEFLFVPGLSLSSFSTTPVGGILFGSQDLGGRIDEGVAIISACGSTLWSD